MRNTIRTVAAAAVIGTATAGASAQQGQAVQWRVEDGGNGHWYQLATARRTFFMARDWCVANGGSLALIDSSQENQFLFQLVLSTSGAWSGAGPFFGLYQEPSSPNFSEPGGGWIWVDGTPRSGRFETFCGGQPDNSWGGQSLAVFWAPSGSPLSCWDDDIAWTDVATYTGSHLIEWSADCNNDGIVDYGQCRDGSLPDYDGNNIPDCCEAGTPCEVRIHPVQWRVEDGGNGHWYLAKRWESPKTWEDARSSAEQMGGYLACVTSAAENQFIYSSSNLYQSGCANGQEGWHLGGFQDLSAPDYSEPAGGWRWISGEPWNYTAWLTGESGGDRPNNFGVGGEQYLKMSEMPYAPRWDDVGVGSSQLLMCGAIIEWSADCNNDGIVDYGQILTGQLADSDADGVPNICQCPGDITGNGAVDGVDLAIVLGAWGTSGQGEFQADIDRDGVVSGTDLAYVLGGWGPCQ